MANRLKMAQQKAIQVLSERGWSQRRIARELGVNRETVGRYVRLRKRLCEAGEAPAEGDSKPAISIPGSDPLKPAISIPGSTGRQSLCEPLREAIIGKLDQGLSAQRIWQDLTIEHGFEGSYQSVQRFARRLRATTPLPFRRLECEPGQEAQIDFGTGAPVIGADGKRRRTHVFRIVLSHSRKAYSEAVYRQSTEAFIRCIENAFLHWGGVPSTLVIDNLKAAVKKADWFDPELNPKIQSFCEHYGTVLLPTKPRMPRHKGKVERGIAYVQGNALKGRRFGSLEEHNRYLRHWESTVADTRIHGTTRKQVRQLFQKVERAALRQLPIDRFPLFQEAERSVHRDAHVEVEKAYYSVPPEYVGWRVWVRWDGRVVRVFNQQWQQIALHVKRDPGRFSTQPQHLASEKISSVERGTDHLLGKARRIGPQSARWAEAMLAERGIQGVRVLVGLLSLSRRYPSEQLEKACETAWTHQAWRLRTLRELLKRHAAGQETFTFMQEHPIIRPLADYGAWVKTMQWDRSME